MIAASHFVEFLPDRELRAFLLHEILQPLLDSEAERGLRLAPTVLLRSGGTSQTGPVHDLKGRAIRCQAIFRCRHNPTAPRQIQYSLQMLPADAERAELARLTPFQIDGTLRLDERGYYRVGAEVRRNLPVG